MMQNTKHQCEQSTHDYHQDTSIALLMAGQGMLKYVLPILMTIAMSAAGFAWNASGQIAVLEAELKRTNAEIEKLREFTDLLNQNPALVQTWVEENFVTQKQLEYLQTQVTGIETQVDNHITKPH